MRSPSSLLSAIILVVGTQLTYIACGVKGGSEYNEFSRSSTDDVTFTFVNQCDQDLWMGSLGTSNSSPNFKYNNINYFNPNNGGWLLPEGKNSTLSVPFDWSAGRFWARTGCIITENSDFICETGDCGPFAQCSLDNVPRSGKPATLAEFTLNVNNRDYYDISLVDGFNVPMKISAVPYDDNSKGDNSNGEPGKFWCGSPECLFDINNICTQVLTHEGRVNGTDETVACYSPCAKWDTDQYCCRGKYNSPSTCDPDMWRVDWPGMINLHCPNVYSYAFDDKTALFNCRNTNYEITLC